MRASLALYPGMTFQPNNMTIEIVFIFYFLYCCAAMNFKLAGEGKLAIKYYLEAAKYAVHVSLQQYHMSKNAQKTRKH